MSYRSWFLNHAKKHRVIIDKLASKSKEEIIEYFRYENLSKKEPDFCPLFKKNKKCHEIEDLNCFLCACPNFRFSDKSVDIKSYCAINSPNGKDITFKGITHHDCSDCLIPHEDRFIDEVFDKDWLKIMSRCDED